MARQRYYGEKFKPTKGAFGNKSKYQKSLERQKVIQQQIAELQVQNAEKLKEAEDQATDDGVQVVEAVPVEEIKSEETATEEQNKDATSATE